MLINRKTERWINAFIAHPQATLLIDAALDELQGNHIAEIIFKELITGKQPILKVHAADERSIGIEEIRILQKAFSQTANRSDAISRIACIYSAHLLTLEAQNALLKLIEELPKRSLIILVGDARKLLTTVVSRCFVIPVLPLEEDRALDYAKSISIPATDAAKSYMLADGSWSAFENYLLSKDTEITDAVELAKKFYTSDVYNRQKIIQSFNKDKEKSVQFIHTLALVAKSAMRFTANTTQKKRWMLNLKNVLQAKKQLEMNVSPRLILLDLSIKL